MKSLSNRIFTAFHIHKECINDINTEQVTKDFIATTERDAKTIFSDFRMAIYKLQNLNFTLKASFEKDIYVT